MLAQSDHHARMKQMAAEIAQLQNELIKYRQQQQQQQQPHQQNLTPVSDGALSDISTALLNFSASAGESGKKLL
jgi:t-SNARE complex subunit (syntaxin)